jgi:beta-lactam-binding protein with PASTA domain
VCSAEFAAERARAFLSMASEPEGPAADTIISDGNRQATPDEVTQADEQWPVSDLYYVDSVDATAAGAVDDDPASTTVVTTSGVGSVRRRLPHGFGVGGMLAALGVLAALVFGGVLLGLSDDEPTATAQGPTSPTSTTPPAETTPAPSSPAQVEVAGVEGISLAEARDQLERQGLEVRVTRSPSERPRGDVLSQAPPAGSRVDEGTVVALVASLGTGSGEQPAEGAVQVPRVVGLSASEAVEELRDAGLEARVRQVASSERQGTVVDQTPSQGTEVADGTAVELEVARPRATAVERIEVPDVIGSAAASARSELRAAGLKVTTIGVVSQESPGTVISQSPRAGADVRKGSRVLLTVSTGPAKVDVPDVSGLDEAAARVELERAGFVVRVTDESTTDPAQDGIVIRQTPAGGSGAQDGDAVTIVVGRLG